MERKALDKVDVKGGSPERGKREEEDFQLIGSELKQALKNLGLEGEEEESLKTPDRGMSMAKKEEAKSGRIEVVKLDGKSAKKESVKEEKVDPKKEEVKIQPVDQREEEEVDHRKEEEESLDRLVKKVDEVYETLDELSRSMVQVNKDLKNKIELINTELDRFNANLRDASGILERVRGEVQGAPPSAQQGIVSDREPTFAAPRQQQPPPPPQSYPPPHQQSYQPPSYEYQSPPPQQPQYYSSRPSYPQQPPPPPPPSLGLSPEEAVARGVEMLRDTIFSDVIPALDQVASIIFSRLLDVREKILRLDPQFPLHEFEPVLSELRANPRMKLSNVDKRKVVDRMVNWANRLPKQP